MIISQRLYRAVRERELIGGATSVVPYVFEGIYDFGKYLDAMYSHEIPSHTLYKNSLYYSWTSDLQTAKQFLNGQKGTGGYVAIAYVDLIFDTEQGMPVNLSDEILFAYPLHRRENWIDMLIMKEYYYKSITNNNKHVRLDNLNYKARKKPYFLSNILKVRNNAYSLATNTNEYVLILNTNKYTVIDNLEDYKEPVRNSKQIYLGITSWILRTSKVDFAMKASVNRVVGALEKDMDFYKANDIISEEDFDDITELLYDYRQAVA